MIWNACVPSSESVEPVEVEAREEQGDRHLGTGLLIVGVAASLLAGVGFAYLLKQYLSHHGHHTTHFRGSEQIPPGWSSQTNRLQGIRSRLRRNRVEEEAAEEGIPSPS